MEMNSRTLPSAARKLLSRPPHRKRSERGRASGSEGVCLAAHTVAVHSAVHAIMQSLKVAEYAGGSLVDPRMIFEVATGELAAIRARFPEWIDRPFVVFQTGGGRTLSWRDWPVENYVKVIRWLQGRFPHTVILTGGAENMERASAMERECPDVINLAGGTTFAETAALLQLAALLFTTDTGVMHLGFAVCPHVICLFHHLCPAEALGPLDESGRHVALQLASPVTMQAPGNRDMEGISCDEAQRAIEGVLRAAAVQSGENSRD